MLSDSVSSRTALLEINAVNNSHRLQMTTTKKTYGRSRHIKTNYFSSYELERSVQHKSSFSNADFASIFILFRIQQPPSQSAHIFYIVILPFLSLSFYFSIPWLVYAKQSFRKCHVTFFPSFVAVFHLCCRLFFLFIFPFVCGDLFSVLWLPSCSFRIFAIFLVRITIPFSLDFPFSKLTI